MSKVQIVREHSWEMAHRLPNHPGLCRFIHGHSYKIQLTISPGPGEFSTETGMVMDFSDVKRVLCSWLDDNWDHRLMLWEKDPLVEAGVSKLLADASDSTKDFFHNLVLVPFIPTAENMATHLGEAIFPHLLARVVAAGDRRISAFTSVSRITLWETAGCFAEWRRCSQ